MLAANDAKFHYHVAALCNWSGEAVYRYTVYKREPEEQQLLYGFKETPEEATEIAERYATIAAEAWEQHYGS